MEVKLEDLMKAKQGLATADVTPDNLPSTEVMTAQVEKAVQELTPEERAQVDKIKDELDLTDSTSVLRFGTPAQQKIAEFSDSVLAQVRTKDSGPVGELLSSLVTQVREFEPEGNSSFLKKIPLVGSLVKKGEDIKQGYEKLSTQVERIQGNLEQAKLKMMKDVALFDKLYAENLSYFKQLQLYIQAGEEKLTEMREVTLPKLRQQAADSGDPMAVQVVADFEASVNRFEKKVQGPYRPGTDGYLQHNSPVEKPAGYRTGTAGTAGCTAYAAGSQQYNQRIAAPQRRDAAAEQH